jgi:hypothetical protein
MRTNLAAYDSSTGQENGTVYFHDESLFLQGYHHRNARARRRFAFWRGYDCAAGITGADEMHIGI